MEVYEGWGGGCTRYHESMKGCIVLRSPRWFKWLTSNSTCLSPGFEPQVGRTLTLFAKIKIIKNSIVESALQRGHRHNSMRVDEGRKG